MLHRTYFLISALSVFVVAVLCFSRLDSVLCKICEEKPEDRFVISNSEKYRENSTNEEDNIS